MKRHRNRALGLTMVEVILSMTIGVMVLGMVAGSVDMMTRGPAKIARQAQARKIGDEIVTRMARDLANAKTISAVIDDIDRSSRFEPRYQLVEMTTAVDDPNGGYKIVKYTWSSTGTPETLSPLMYGYGTEFSGSRPMGYSYELWPRCRLRLRYETEVSIIDESGLKNSLDVFFTGANSSDESNDRALDLFEKYCNDDNTDGTLEVLVRAIHIELTVADEGGTYTIWRTVHCREKPPLLAYWACLPGNTNCGCN